MSEGHVSEPGGRGATSSGEEPRDLPAAEPAEPAWKRRRRLAEVFGDVLPGTTNDERGPDGGRGGRSGDDWLREQVPPHHGG
ncbi:hypothetical protein [Nocardioides sp. GY 10127]|uniref:hypothetical protein n=1 Tax=Nocardioides sp. GY 10127 TaxID=2569762 RepID=UPI0010A82634|nr:hypothetical protein [Nocardioides sp. GY 10127]TIC79098.1 hypothetical protein E8D37_18200 [Nocardioides sp. GY 10127]